MRATRGNAKLLEQSLVNCTVKALQFEATSVAKLTKTATDTPKLNSTARLRIEGQ